MNSVKNFSIIHIDTTDSTNLYLDRMISQREAEEGLIIMASDQTEGRGQRGTKWYSEPGKNLTFSVLLKPHFLNVASQFTISKVIALSVLELLQELLTGLDIKIKWPNDILVNDRKIAGILITAQIKENKIEHAIAGIGININQREFASKIPNPASVIHFTNSETDLGDCLTIWMKKFEWYYSLLKQGGTDHINGKYLECLFRFNIEAHYFYQGKKISGIIKGVTDEGLLVLCTPKSPEGDFRSPPSWSWGVVGEGFSTENQFLILCDAKELVYLD